MDKLIKDILAAAKEVHTTLGDGFQEQIYEEAMQHELALKGIPSERWYKINVTYKGITLQKSYIPDLYVSEKVLVEIKTVKNIKTIDESQLVNYLKVANVSRGMLLNFGTKLEAVQRIWSGATGTPTAGTPTDPEELKGNNPETM